MGWGMVRQPRVLLAASETAREVTEKLADEPEGSLPEHPLEALLIRPQDWPEDNLEMTSTKFTKIMEVCIDDFVQLAPTTDPAKLRHLSRAVHHGIHSVVLPPAAPDTTERKQSPRSSSIRVMGRTVGGTEGDPRMGVR